MGKEARIKTYIPGFDKLVQGGFVPGSVNLVTGGPGSGKTTFVLQFLIEGAEKSKEKGLFITFEESLDSLKGDALQHGWDIAGLQKKGKCYFYSLEPFNNPALLTQIAKLVKTKKATRVVVDSLSMYSLSFKDDQYRVRKEMYLLCGLFRDLGCTTILTGEVSGEPSLDISAGNSFLSKDGILEFVTDSVITMHNAGLGGEADRAIRVLKMRRTKHERSPMPMKITDKGMSIVSGK